MIVGTPRHMAPEQVRGEAVDGRTDLFAVGAILFEMLAGRPAFAGRTAVEVLHATLYEQPPALTGSPAIAAIDRVVRRALAKAPKDRYSTAGQMSDDLRAALRASGTEAAAVARPLTRLVVLPLRAPTPRPTSWASGSPTPSRRRSRLSDRSSCARPAPPAGSPRSRPT